jgi:hypothetical protein
MAVTISGVTISNGVSTVSGGGIYSLYSDLTLTGVAFTGNSAPNGSALYVGGSNLTITSSAFSGGSGTGAAIGYDTLTPTNFVLSNSTISGNSAGWSPAWSGSRGERRDRQLHNCQQQRQWSPGWGQRWDGQLQLRGNIIAGNAGSSLALFQAPTHTGTQGYNLASDGGAGLSDRDW